MDDSKVRTEADLEVCPVCGAKTMRVDVPGGQVIYCPVCESWWEPEHGVRPD